MASTQSKTRALVTAIAAFFALGYFLALLVVIVTMGGNADFNAVYSTPWARLGVCSPGLVAYCVGLAAIWGVK